MLSWTALLAVRRAVVLSMSTSLQPDILKENHRLGNTQQACDKKHFSKQCDIRAYKPSAALVVAGVRCPALSAMVGGARQLKSACGCFHSQLWQDPLLVRGDIGYLPFCQCGNSSQRGPI
jgi:hypothetical protein